MVTKQDLINDPLWFMGATKIGSEIRDVNELFAYTIRAIEISDNPMSADNVSKTDEDAVIHDTTFGKIVVYEDGDYFMRIDSNSNFVRSIPRFGFETIFIPFEAVDDEYQVIAGNTVHTITIAGMNDAPDAVDDEVTTPEDTSVTVDVLVNDGDIDGDDITLIDVSDGENGTAEIVDGEILYTPNAN